MTATEALDRTALGDAIAARLNAEHETLAAAFAQWGAFVVDAVLPEASALAIAEAFPPCEAMVAKNTVRERKHIGVDLNTYDPLVREALFSWQQPNVVAAVATITGLAQVEPDPELYAGGISATEPGGYLRPHVDNSHDGARERYRALNLLYYVTPGWREEDGGALEIWDDEPGRPGAEHPHAFPALFNRVVVMATSQNSWHSVSPVTGSKTRRCVSNYYFSPTRPNDARTDYFHVTTFRGRPAEPLVNAALHLDGAARATLRKLFPKGVAPTTHVYRPRDDDADT